MSPHDIGGVISTDEERIAAARTVSPRPPRPPRIDQPQQWASGRCHLYCGRTDVPVAWLAPVKVDGVHRSMYACKRCHQALAQKLDECPDPPPPAKGRHRRSTP